MKFKFSDEIHQPYCWMLAFAILGVALIPVETRVGTTVEHFQFGWPLPLISGKVDFIDTVHLSGLQLYHGVQDLVLLGVSLLFWIGIFWASLTIIKNALLPDWLIFSGIILTFSAVAVAYLFLGFQFLAYALFG